MTKPRTLYDKIWDEHLVHRRRTAPACIYIDRHLVHEVTSPQAFEGLRMAGPQGARAGEDARRGRPQRADHRPLAQGIDDPESALQVADAGRRTPREFGIEYYHERDSRQGIVHVVGPEQGFTLPGMTIVCGDSHTSTHGAFGALAFGIGTSRGRARARHPDADPAARRRTCASRVDGELPAGVAAKDIVLAIIGEIGTAGGTGHVIEYAGEAIRALSMEGRMTLCNMSIEGGARAGLIAPDEKTFDYHQGPPAGAQGRRLGDWRCATGRRSTPTRTPRSTTRSCSMRPKLPPLVTWGTSPEHVVAGHRQRARSRDEIADETSAAPR